MAEGDGDGDGGALILEDALGAFAATDKDGEDGFSRASSRRPTWQAAPRQRQRRPESSKQKVKRRE